MTTKPPPKMAPTVALTPEQVREALAQGRAARAELEKIIDKMHRLTVEERFTPAK